MNREPNNCPCNTQAEIPTKESAASATRTEPSRTPVVSKSMSCKSKSNGDVEREIRSHEFDSQIYNENSDNKNTTSEQDQANGATKLQKVSVSEDTIVYKVN